jgi:hypothetical protein
VTVDPSFDRSISEEIAGWAIRNQFGNHQISFSANWSSRLSVCPMPKRITFAASTLVHFRALSPEEISRYLASGEEHDKAGAYGIQGRAGRFISRIEGCYSALPWMCGSWHASP